MEINRQTAPFWRLYRDTLGKRTIRAKGNRLTLSMLVRNEAERYLERVLTHAKLYIDNAVILDDASTDRTVEICREILYDIPLTIVSNSKSGFSNEVTLRKQQWKLVTETTPDWILVLDADEIFENRAQRDLRNLIDQPKYDYYSFRLYDFWDEEMYREDAHWTAHEKHRPFLVRYLPWFPYKWKETAQHCGRMPINVKRLKGFNDSLRIKHYGWKNPIDRESKYKRYMELDPTGQYGDMEQYASILSPHPKLVKWEEDA